MDICKIKKLIELVEELGIIELEVFEEEGIVCISCVVLVVVLVVV